MPQSSKNHIASKSAKGKSIIGESSRVMKQTNLKQKRQQSNVFNDSNITNIIEHDISQNHPNDNLEDMDIDNSDEGLYTVYMFICLLLFVYANFCG